MEGRAFDRVVTGAAGFSSVWATAFAAGHYCQLANDPQPLRYVPVL